MEVVVELRNVRRGLVFLSGYWLDHLQVFVQGFQVLGVD